MSISSLLNKKKRMENDAKILYPTFLNEVKIKVRVNELEGREIHWNEWIHFVEGRRRQLNFFVKD